MAEPPSRLVILDDALMDQVRDSARQSGRRRAVHRFHEHEEPVQRMLNAIEPDSYVRPHKHEAPDKVEMFLALRGRAAVVTFADDGTVLPWAPEEGSPDGPGYLARLRQSLGL